MTFKERAHDLFIPIRRKQRSSSGETTPISTSKPSLPEAPKTPTRRTNELEGFETLTKNSTFVPSSGLRYPVATGKSYTPFSFIPKSSSPLKSETTDRGTAEPVVKQVASARQDVKHSRTASLPVPWGPRQASPSQSMRRSVHSYPLIDPINLEVQIAEEQIVRTAMPTPFPSPDSQTSETKLESYSHRDLSRNYAVTENTPSDRIRSSLRGNHVDSAIMRPRSRDSSRSSKNRSHPPSSFPTTLLDHVPEPSMAQVSPSKASHIRPKAKQSDRSAKRYTIIGLPSAAPDIQEDRPPRRNSVGQAGDTTPYSHHSVRVNHMEPRSVNQQSMVPLRLTAQPHSQSSSRPSSRHSLSSSHNPTVSDFSFHTTVHHYTTCSHTSPPKSRPLNEQPQLELYLSDSDPEQEIHRNIIRGSCFDCDTAARRGEETQVLLQFNPEISRLMNDLTHLVSMVEESVLVQKNAISPPRTPVSRGFTTSDKFSPGKSSIVTKETSDSASTGKTTATNVFTDSTSITTESSHDGPEAIERQISHLQHVITQLSKQRDIEVNKIWAGYTARWGPGTLGVAQTKRTGSVSSRSVSRVGSNSRPSSMIEASSHSAHDTFYYESGDASLASSARNSPQKATFNENSADGRDLHDADGFSVQSSLHNPHPQAYITPKAQRRQNVRYSTGSTAQSFYSSLSHHQRGRSSDSTPNTPFGGRSVARTETGISYSSSDTPVGRMKVNWVRDSDQS